MTLGSLFDGIGGWLIAASHNDVKPLWSSEIDDFPSAVSHYHFPDVKQYGDITRLNGAEIEPVDILCAGSPCQDLSVAGKQQGLDGERSCLFHEAIRIMREMRKATNGEYPKYFVWENVPGAFSTHKGADFRAVLSEITESEIPMPKSGRWAEAGMVRSDVCTVSYRCLDAQYWGVPQRRKRLFLVGDFTDGRSGEILFECQGLPGDSEKSQGAGQTAPRNAGASVDSSGNSVNFYDMTHADEVIRTIHGNKADCLKARMGTGGNNVPLVHAYAKVASTLRAGAGAPKHMSDIKGRIVQTFPIEGNGARPSHKGDGYCESDKMYTLNTIERHAVCIGNGQLHQIELSDKVGTLNCMHDQQCVMT